MKSLQVNFEIIEGNRCPFYKVGEQLILSDKSLSCPENKTTCLILVREMTQLLFKFLATNPDDLIAEKPVFNCSGCTGLIKFVPISTSDVVTKAEIEPVVFGSREREILEKIRVFPLIQVIPDDELKEFIGRCQQKSVREGALLIHKGEANSSLYFIISGQVLVIDGPVVITTLGPGEICGEMSYLGGEVAGASVRALCDTEVLVVSNEDFNYLLDKLPAVQMFMARLLAKRLTRVNKARAEDFSSCMQGRLQDMAPAELFQVFHMNSKTGVLFLDLPHGPGKISFREGCIINAHYQGHENEEAIFAMLGEHEGTYRFTIGLSPQEMKAAEVGDFMKLLMEGIKRVDDALEEKDASFARNH
jgi:CRP/FNR family transcriptional regulator, cyclic AMP receptor protein